MLSRARSRRVAVALAVAISAALAASATATLTPSYDLFILRAKSPFFAKDEPYVRTAPGGAVKFRTVYVRNVGEADAPRTRVGFRWLRLRDNNKTLRTGPILRTARVAAIPAADQRHTGKTTVVPLPTRNGRYRIEVCANTPEADRPEKPRENNCSELRRIVVIDREVGTPDPGQFVVLSSSPASGQFGQVAPGTQSQPINFTISNSGKGSTGPGVATLAGDYAGWYRVTTNGCAGGLNGLSSCRVGVVYAPPNTASGTYEATLIVSFGGGASIQIPLSGSS